MKRRLFILLPLVSILITGCSKPEEPKKDISIVYTTDVHCGLDNNLGYTALYSYKEKLKETNHVTLVDSGDYLQGEFVGAVSNGEYIVEVMNKVGYDIVTLGNHEFDYGMSELSSRLSEFHGEVTSCNFSYIGHKENKFTRVKPYIIKDYGYKKIGYVGVTTPKTLTASDPTNFLEDGVLAYDFGASTKEAFYTVVQSNIDACKNAGADYVVLLSHLGSTDNYKPFSSRDVIANTSGVTAFLDGHAHTSLPWEKVKNKNNVDTLLVGAGYKLNRFASLTFKLNGDITYSFIDECEQRSPVIDEFVEGVKQKAEEAGSKVVANIDVDLSISDENGNRMVRNREVPIANLVADAYRIISRADIGFINGGGVRDDLKKGDVTFEQIKKVHPYGNLMMVKKTTGQTILDYLEFASMKTEHERLKDGKSTGEFGGFAQISGLKYEIDTSIPSSVVTTEVGEFIRIDGPRRVKNVLVLQNDEFVAIDPEKEYTVCSNDFLLDKGGDGANMFKNNPTIESPSLLDYEVVIKYIVDVCEGKLASKYSAPEGRITVL